MKEKNRKPIHVDARLHTRLKSAASRSEQKLGAFTDLVLEAGLRELAKKRAS